MREAGPGTMLFAVLGHPIAHSLSPAMHQAAFSALKRNALYLAFDVAPGDLSNVLPVLRTLGFRGVNLTVPLKETAWKALEDLDESARRMRAVNTLLPTPAGWRGFNTDGAGLMQALREAFDKDFETEHVFILGTGGAGRAAALTAARQGAAELVLCDRAEDRARRVAGEIQAEENVPPVHCVPPSDAEAAARAAGLIIQATPVGMHPGDPSPLGARAFRAGQKVLDMIYMYPQTPLMALALESGAAAVNGLGMLLHQGAEALRLWTGWTPPIEAMRRALERKVYR